ncbi:uncharacterized protein PAC_04208 [Phialocephala subalpina]|uniref:Uncharacterized protein n=1 Tax=Phialocephala subalpina TaxID=576137 RepID=A0A1L7WNH3_9HELO|nr:uncharacterized protein PAC_04208 [Phialocephala subalpina]
MRLLAAFVLFIHVAAILALPFRKAREAQADPVSAISVRQRSISFERPPPSAPTNRVIKKFTSMPSQGYQLQAKSRTSINALRSSISFDPSTSLPAPTDTTIKIVRPMPSQETSRSPLPNGEIKRLRPMHGLGRRMVMHKRGMAVGAILGVVLGGVAIVCGVVFIGWMLLGKNK